MITHGLAAPIDNNTLQLHLSLRMQAFRWTARTQSVPPTYQNPIHIDTLSTHQDKRCYVNCAPEHGSRHPPPSSTRSSSTVRPSKSLHYLPPRQYRHSDGGGGSRPTLLPNTHLQRYWVLRLGESIAMGLCERRHQLGISARGPLAVVLDLVEASGLASCGCST